jgi:hypothetical protein
MELNLKKGQFHLISKEDSKHILNKLDKSKIKVLVELANTEKIELQVSNQCLFSSISRLRSTPSIQGKQF